MLTSEMIKLKNLTPRKGAIAICSLGSIGLITSDEPQEVTYADGNKAVAWTGIHLTDKIAPIGSPWSSREPRVWFYIGYAHDDGQPEIVI